MVLTRPLFRSCAPAAVFFCLFAVSAEAQVQIQIGANGTIKGEEPLNGGNLFEQDRDKTRILNQAKTFLKSKNYPKAIQALQHLIDAEKDSFYFENTDKRTKFLSTKSESMRLLATLPEVGRKVYELQYGLKARRELEDALTTGEFSVIEEVARRFFHTAAGYEATYALATHQFDHGNYLSAALNFDRLRKVQSETVRDAFEPMLSLQTAVSWGRAGLPELSVSTLISLKQTSGSQEITLGGKKIPFFQRNEDALKWLVATLGGNRAFRGLGKEEWTQFRGDASRTARSAPASPVWDTEWKIDTIRRADVKEVDRKNLDEVVKEIADLKTLRRRQSPDSLMLPAVHPLIVGDLAIFRTLRNIWAVHIRTGKLAWQGVIKDRSYGKVAGFQEDQDVQLRTTTRRTTGTTGTQLDTTQMFLDQRLWRDLTAGTLSSDGDLVFSVERLRFYNPAAFAYNSRTRSTGSLQSYNRLVAYEAKTGKLKLMLGGSTDNSKDPLAGHFFLGPPLPLGEQLFCLTDYRGNIQLMALGLTKERRNGELHVKHQVLWSQLLITAQEGVARYPLRRMAGLTPSYSGGVLICPTTGGAVVAVDPARRLLLWGYRYPTNADAGYNQANPFIRQTGRVPMNPYDAESRWLDAAATIADGRLLLTPRDSNELHCVNLLDGTLLWKRPRGSMLYTATVFDGYAVMAGRTEIQSIGLADGNPAWKQSTPLPTPSGRGFQTGAQYHIPLETGEIATIDLTTGRVLARTKTRSGFVPGNLVSANGLIISQSIDQVTGFKPLDTLEKEIEAKLKANPNDAQALTLRGEIRLRSGDEAAGLADLRAAIMANPTERAKSLVASVLLEGLRLDFAANRKYAKEIERLATTTQQQAQYRRLLAAGLHEVGEYREAFREYLKLAGIDTSTWKQERLEGGRTVRGDRWLQSRLADLFAKASKDDRAALVREVDAQFRESAKKSGPAALRRFVRAFSGLPTVNNARMELAKRLDAKTQPLELEFLLQRMRESSDPVHVSYAAARLAELFSRHSHYDAAADLLAELEGKFADTKCIGGKTGRAYAAELKSAHPQLKQAAADRSPWPDKRMYVSATQSGSRSSQRFYPLDFEGNRGPYFKDWSFALNSSNRSVVARDGYGKIRWQLPTSQTRNSSFNYYGNTLQAHGHLLVMTLGNRFVVIDGLSPNPRVLWERNLYESTLGQAVNRGIMVRRMIRRNGRMRWIIAGPNGYSLGMVGPITDDAIIYQAGKTVYAADPVTGAILWQRKSVDRGCRLFGDENHVFAVPPGTTTAMVLRGSDGKLLGSRKVSSESASKATNGQFELDWHLSGTKYLLTYTDILSGKIAWQKQYSSSAKLEMIEGDEVAVVEPDRGRFHVVALKTGKSIVDQPINPDNNLVYFMIRRSKDRYLMLSYSNSNPNQQIFRVNGLNYYSPLVNGFVYGFNRETGKKEWATWVGHQSIDDAHPDNMPVLILAARRYQNVVAGGARVGRYRNRLVVDILDVRNGRLLFHYDSPESVSSYEMTVKPQQKEIEVSFYQTVVRITMSDKALRTPVIEKNIPNRAQPKPPGNKVGAAQGAGNVPAVPVPVQRAIPIRRR